MYIIAGSTGTLGSAITEELAKNHEIFLIGRDESKLKEQADKYNCKYEVIDLTNTPEPREFSKIIDQEVEITGLTGPITEVKFYGWGPYPGWIINFNSGNVDIWYTEQ